MGEYFGFDIDENEEGDFESLLMGVDPKHHEAIAWGLSQLCKWYGDKAYRELDEWFTVIYGTVLMVEEKNRKALKPGVTKINVEDLVEKPIDRDQGTLF